MCWGWERLPSFLQEDLQDLQSLGMGLSSPVHTPAGTGVLSAPRREMLLAATASECHVPATWPGEGRKEVPTAQRALCPTPARPGRV